MASQPPSKYGVKGASKPANRMPTTAAADRGKKAVKAAATPSKVKPEVVVEKLRNHS